MKLDKFHVLYSSFGTIDHGDAITSGNIRIGRCAIYLSVTTSCKYSYRGKDLNDFIIAKIQSIYTITFNIRRSLGNQVSQMVLCDDIQDKAMLDHFNILLPAHSFKQSPFN